MTAGGRTKSIKDKQTLLKEIIGNLQTATNNCLKLIKAVLHSEADLFVRTAPAGGV